MQEKEAGLGFHTRRSELAARPPPAAQPITARGAVAGLMRDIWRAAWI